MEFFFSYEYDLINFFLVYHIDDYLPSSHNYGCWCLEGDPL